MTFLALDLSLKTGWALGVPGVIEHGVFELKEKARQLKGTRYLTFREHLERLHSKHKITRVGYEIVHRHEGVLAAHVYGGLQAVLSMFCISHGIPRDEIEVKGNKKAFTGKGNASKQDMIERAEALGFRPQDDNAADALALLDFMFNKYGIGSLISAPSIEDAFL